MVEENIEAFLSNAKEHLETAEIILRSNKYFDVVFHSIMSIENSTSAIILKLGALPSKRHSNHLILHHLLPEVKVEWRGEYEKVISFAAELLPQISLTRYPFIKGDKILIPSQYYSREDGEKALEKARFVYSFAEKLMEKPNAIADNQT
ncbi:MAG: HEPN domain-containing protein [Methanocellales archaeon]